MIVTLAGHVDHGKTSLVRALSGVNTDRLAEEQQRGLTIDLGFAYIDGGQIGFVDVPGHQKFIHNMVAGVAANQYAMLVIAADDGPMPQSREHLEILRLTGIAAGCVVITKSDRVTAERLRTCEEEVHNLVQQSFLQARPVFVTSTEDSASFTPLLEHLRAQAQQHANTQRHQPFRLAVDRSFNVKGAGLVITGTAHSGSVTTDEHLFHYPSGQSVRVRGIRTQDQEASTAGSGERCALNIAGMELANIQRGDWLSATPPARYRALSVQLHVSKDFPRAVKHWTPVHVYHATHHCQGRLALAPGQRLEPGQTAQIDLVLDESIYCHRDDRLILRDHGLDTTLGGGSVIYAETIAPRRRQGVRRQQHIAAYALKTPKDCLTALLQAGITDLQLFRDFWHLADADYTTLVNEFVLHHSGDFALSDEHWLKHKTELQEQFTASPDEALRENQLLDTIPSAFRQALLNELVQDKTLTHTGGEYKLLGQALKLPDHLVKLWELLEPALAHNQAPSTGDLAKRFNIAQNNLERGMNELVKTGLLIHVANHRYYLPNQLKDVAKIVKRMAATEPLTVRGFRDETGIGRNVAIEVLEYFDSKGFTRRQGNDRIILNPTIFD